MATVSVTSASTTFNSNGRATFDITFSESVSGMSASAFIRNSYSGGLNYNGVSGNRYSYAYSSQASSVVGYVRVLLPVDAVTPNLDEPLDWTFYWDDAGNISHGATDAVRASRVRTTLNNVRWLGSNGNAGSSQQIELEFDRLTHYLSSSDISLQGDITTLSGLNFYFDRDRYRFNVSLPSSLAGGGSFTLQIPGLESVYPGLAVSEEWTLSWTEGGRLSAIRTADIPVEISLSLDKTYVTSSEEIVMTLRYNKDSTPVPIADISLTDGVQIRSANSNNDRHWTYILTAPATGKGVGVVSIPEDVILPGNNAVSATFTYIDAINAEISLSAAAIENGGTIIAQFDFDYDVPNFEGAFVAVNNPDAVIGSATALDDNSRCWVVPVTVPQAGEGELEIELPEDAIGFQSAAVMAPVQFAPTIALSIGSFASPLEWIFGIFRSVEIDITGNDIKSVRLTGLTRPFYSHWDATNGKLYLRGRPEEYYEDLAFTITVVDADDTATASGIINVVDIAPVIIPPVGTIQLAQGHKNSVFIEVQNFPKEGSVESDYLNLDHSFGDEGFTIEGDIPARGSGANQAIFGVNSGELILNAENSGGSAMEVRAAWEFSSASAPIWDTSSLFVQGKQPFYPLEIGDVVRFILGLYVSAVPRPEFSIAERSPFQLQEGLELSPLTGNIEGTVSGTPGTSQPQSVDFLAKNTITGRQSRINFVVLPRNSIILPSYIGPTSLPAVNIEIGFGPFQDINLDNLFSKSTNRLAWQNFEFYELLGLNDDLLYQHDIRHLNSQSRRAVFGFSQTHLVHQMFAQGAFFITNAEWRSTYRGTSRTVQIRKTTRRGSAITPEFTLNFV